jgi:hypothetical protein
MFIFQKRDQVLHPYKKTDTLNVLCNLIFSVFGKYEGVSKSFRTGRLERELQVVQLSATTCSCIILWVSLVSFVVITLCIASQRVFVFVGIYSVMTQSGNFWLHSRIRLITVPELYEGKVLWRTAKVVPWRTYPYCPCSTRSKWIENIFQLIL